MDIVIYSLCTVTSLACAVLLLRGYVQSRARILLWSALCFACLTASNAILTLDFLIFTDVSLYTWRLATALAGFVLLVVGLVLSQD